MAAMAAMGHGVSAALAPPVPQPPAAQPTGPGSIPAGRHRTQSPGSAAVACGTGGAGATLVQASTSAVESFHAELTEQLKRRLHWASPPTHDELTFAAANGRSLHFIVQHINKIRAAASTFLIGPRLVSRL